MIVEAFRGQTANYVWKWSLHVDWFERSSSLLLPVAFRFQLFVYLSQQDNCVSSYKVQAERFNLHLRIKGVDSLFALW